MHKADANQAEIGTPCPRDGLRGPHVCVGRAEHYARSGEAAGG